MKIVVFCEGETEKSLKDGLRELVQRRSEGARRIGLSTRKLNGPTVRKKLGRLVEQTLSADDVVGVVALTDVYPEYEDAEQAKTALRRFAGKAARDNRFRAHAAKFEIEAWMIPLWDEIARTLKSDAKKPSGRPEEINGETSPAEHLDKLYKRAKIRSKYVKAVHAARWLTADNLENAAEQCPELKSFLDSLYELARTNKNN